MYYNVLIVDDELLIRTGLRLSIPWQELGFKVTAEAGTALEAMEKLENNRIDLALVDIQMPGTNGIEFIRKMRERFPHIKSLIISGHSDFEYTVSALKLEVSDYLLKPINQKSLIETVTKLKNQMNRENEKNQILQSQKTAAGKMLVLRLLGKDFSNREEVFSYCSGCGIAVPLEGFCVTAVRHSEFITMLDAKFKRNRSLYEAFFDKALYGQVEHEPDTIFTAMVGDYYVAAAHRDHIAEIRGVIYQRAREAREQVYVGTGESFQDIFFMNVSYLQAIEEIGRKEERQGKKTKESQLSYYSSFMIQKLEERKFDEAKKVAGLVFTESLTLDTGALFNWCMNTLYSIVDYFQLANYEEMKGIMVFDIQSVSTLYFYAAMQSMFMEKFQKICAFLKGMTGNSNEMMINKVCSIVKEEYANPELSLQNIAAQLDISYNYLSTVFKQISGENFSGYLTRVKMNHAKKLLLGGNYKMYEIAEQVGYLNAKYFTEQFKKSVGMTPSEFKSANRKGRDEDGISI